MKTPFNISVSSAAGIEQVTKRELKLLGIPEAPAINGRITFSGDERTVALCNLYLRTANRVYITVASFKALDFNELYDGVRAIEWWNYFPQNAKIIVSGKCASSKLMAVSACCSVTKKAICDRLFEKYGGTLGEDGDRYKVEISLYKNIASVSLDTSGDGLHRRGYRGLVGEAPLKETLAAALIFLSGWNGRRPLADLFCGTGTIPIEAAMYAMNIAPGLKRDFDFLHWKNFDSSFFLSMKEDAESKIDAASSPVIYGFDIDERQIKLAVTHASLAGVGDKIHFQRADMRDFSTKHKNGVFISNPPYGERLSERKEIKKLYADYGALTDKYPDWDRFVLTSVSDCERLIGKTADKKRKIYNGKLECAFYMYHNTKNLHK